jgi:hypothetical protein
MAAIPDNLTLTLDVVTNKVQEPVLIVVRGLDPGVDGAQDTLQKIHDDTGCEILALGPGLTVEYLDDEQLRRCGLRRI